MIKLPWLRLAQAVLDTLLCVVVYIFVYLLRFEGQIPEIESRAFWFCLPLLPALRLGANYLMGLYSHLWAYVGLRELFSIFKAVTLGSISFILATYLFGVVGFPRSVFVFEAGFYFLTIGALRFTRRFSREVGLFSRTHQASRTLIVGAGDAGAMVAAEMLRQPENGFKPVGFIDDNPQKWKARIHELRVFGPRSMIPDVVENRDIDTVVLAMPSVSRAIIKEIVDLCSPLKVSLKIVPATHQILSGEVKIEQLRQIQIEDLLGREPVNIDDTELADFLKDKRILVTGAGGSIGSELCRQILEYDPASLYLLGHGENSIYQLQTELRSPRVRPVIADIRHQGQLIQAFERLKPEVIFHAAAHKHVPLMEQNIYESFMNNVWGSYQLLQAAAAQGVQKLVLISTDKSPHPSSVMGLSKYFAELALFAQAQRKSEWLSVVRFGNVIGSRGSVIPLFQRQIEAGGPITVTHPEMTRYFMTIPEAVQLVLQASIIQQKINSFILDMGEPVKIIDLARNMIRLSGLNAQEIAIETVGMRKGEKLHETLVWDDEALESTRCPQVMSFRPDAARLQRHLALFEKLLPCLAQPHSDAFWAFYKSDIQPEFFPEVHTEV